MTEKIYQIESPPMQMEKLRGAIFQKMLNDPEIKAALIRSDEDY